MLKHIKNIYEDYYIDENGMKQGEYKAYHYNGQLRQICNYVNNKIHGTSQEFHNTGKLKSIQNYTNGLRDGVTKAYNVKGVKILHQNWVNNALQGEYKSYYKNGVLRHYWNYLNSVPHGICIYQDKRAKVISKTFLVMGEKIDVSAYGMDINNLTNDDLNFLKVIYG